MTNFPHQKSAVPFTSTFRGNLNCGHLSCRYASAPEEMPCPPISFTGKHEIGDMPFCSGIVRGGPVGPRSQSPSASFGIGRLRLVSSALISLANASKGLAPLRKRPLMKKAGVPVTPKAEASEASVSTTFLLLRSKKSASNRFKSRPSSLACWRNASNLRFFWLANSLS